MFGCSVNNDGNYTAFHRDTVLRHIAAILLTLAIAAQIPAAACMQATPVDVTASCCTSDGAADHECCCKEAATCEVAGVPAQPVSDAVSTDIALQPLDLPAPVLRRPLPTLTVRAPVRVSSSIPTSKALSTVFLLL